MISKREVLTKNVIGFPITALPLNMQIDIMLNWAKHHFSKCVYIANVPVLIEAHQTEALAAVLASADLLPPEGTLLVEMLRLIGAPQPERVSGVDIFQALCEQAAEQDVSVFLLGSQAAILQKIQQRLIQDLPTLKIAGAEPLPFRPLSSAENEAIIQKIHHSGAGLIFVSLGFPKQEYWIAEQKGKVNGVMVGLGGAFPSYAGVHSPAVEWQRSAGLEGLVRLLREPLRLWSRYDSAIPTFIFLALKQLLLWRNEAHFSSQKKI